MSLSHRARGSWFSVVTAAVLFCVGGRVVAQEGVAEPPTDPQSIAELAPAAIPAEDNAAALLEQAAPLVHGWEADHVQFLNSPLGVAYEEREDRGEPPTADQAAAIRELMARHAELDDLLARAADCEAFASRGDFSVKASDFIAALLPRIQLFRSVGRYYAMRMRALSSEGRHDEAARHGIELLKLTRLHEREPTMVAYLVTLAVRNYAVDQLYDALAAGPVAFDIHTQLDTELDQIDDPQAFGRMLRWERAVTLSSQAEQNGPLGLAAALNVGVGTGAGKYMDAVIAASGRPWREFQRAVQDGAELGKPTKFGMLADLLTPAVGASASAHGRTVAMVRSLRAFNALRMFAKLEGREATGLAELELPVEALADPYGAGPLQAKLTEDGWLIYSVLNNGVNDGGDFRDLRDYGVAPARHRARE
jgi:hypothetical protein